MIPYIELIMVSPHCDVVLDLNKIFPSLKIEAGVTYYFSNVPTDFTDYLDSKQIKRLKIFYNPISLGNIPLGAIIHDLTNYNTDTSIATLNSKVFSLETNSALNKSYISDTRDTIVAIHPTATFNIPII